MAEWIKSYTKSLILGESELLENGKLLLYTERTLGLSSISGEPPECGDCEEGYALEGISNGMKICKRSNPCEEGKHIEAEKRRLRMLLIVYFN